MDKKQEKLLREYVRKQIVQPILEESKKEQQVRLWVRSVIREAMEEEEWTVIYEGKDVVPHPSTAINFLRDSFNKLTPNLEKDYKSLTTNPEQRVSFVKHYLSGIIRMFDQADGLSAEVDIENYSDLGLDKVSKPVTDNSSPEETADSIDDMEKQIQALQEVEEEEVETTKAVDVNVVDALKPDAAPKGGMEGEIDKTLTKTNKLDQDRGKFGKDVEGDVTGRNKAYDSLKNNNGYLLTNYKALGQDDDKMDFKKWSIYNLDLLFKGFEQELLEDPDLPEIANPDQQI
jgi:hypothetical protein